ncbi:MAG: 3-phosphoshikimate 1-carboxyvinyltransferase [Clostridiales bacterium]|jgi:3-phosphoshikimate 1-carboxyvinyltransferase|nr:3-phosphoshikimate 1-carboxyvinyltransferase [Clostridiales bacterium]
MSTAVVSNAFSGGRVRVPPSKSHLHRLLIGAALCGGTQRVAGLSHAADVEATARCLTALGARIRSDETGYTVTPPQGVPPCNAVADCGESGSTLRFLLPVAAALGREITFTGAPRLGERPVRDLTDCLSAHGVSVSSDFPYRVSGRLTPGTFTVTGGVSSQFITGLLLALPLLTGNSELVVTGPTVSRPYIEITLDVLDAFGIAVSKTPTGFAIPGGQRFCAAAPLIADGDWSCAAFWLVAGAIRAPVTLAGLDTASRQGDKRVLDLISAAGAHVHTGKDGICVSPAPLSAFAADVCAMPDAVPALAVLAAYCRGTSSFTGVERLRDKESDRLAGVIDMLTALGIEARYDGAALRVTGGTPSGGTVAGRNDHRLVMAGAVAALAATGDVTVTDAHAAAKSYPAFFAELRTLGGHVHGI